MRVIGMTEYVIQYRKGIFQSHIDKRTDARSGEVAHDPSGTVVDIGQDRFTLAQTLEAREVITAGDHLVHNNPR